MIEKGATEYLLQRTSGPSVTAIKKAVNDVSSVLHRMASILNLLSEDFPFIVVSSVEKSLGVSSATAYRYLSDMCESGLLYRVSGHYAPGPKILELEYLINRFDPILASCKSTMSALSSNTGCHVLLARLYGESLVNIFYAKGRDLPELNFSIGRKLPLFLGSQAHVVLAFMERRKLRRIFDAHEGDAARNKIGKDWTAFSAAMDRTRRLGHYISRNELDENTTGVAAPIFDERGYVIGSVVLVFSSSDSPWVGENAIVNVVVSNAREISERIGAGRSRPLGPNKLKDR